MRIRRAGKQEVIFWFLSCVPAFLIFYPSLLRANSIEGRTHCSSRHILRFERNASDKFVTEFINAQRSTVLT